MLLCWKIRRGLSLKVDESRIAAYTEWFFKEHLFPHFKIEEEEVFPLLLNENSSVLQALKEHKELNTLFNSKAKDKAILLEIADKLDAHIRFEERFLFNEIQNAVSNDEWAKIDNHIGDKGSCEVYSDSFWVIK